MSRADLEDASLTNADVTGANFQGASLEVLIGLRDFQKIKAF
ncbi:pentapeptide repeat-containing protein [Anabaena subtropica]|nr:pentapeptide repeat-containing protein [Anabaena subtropica]